MDLLKPSYATGYAKNASQSAHPNLWDGLVGAWMPSMGVTGTSIYDLSERKIEERFSLGASGNLINCDPSTAWVTSKGKKAIELNGSNQYIGHIIEMKREELTIEVEFEWDDFNSNSVQFLCSGTYEKMEIHLGGIGVNGVRFIPFDFPNSGTLDSLGACSSGRNHFVFTAKHGKQSEFYKSGALVTRSPSSGNATGRSLTTERFLSWGRRLASNTFYFDGKLFNWKIYNRVLSPSEIKQLYVDSLAPFRKKQRVSVAVPAAVAPSATYHPLRSLAHPLEQ